MRVSRESSVDTRLACGRRPFRERRHECRAFAHDGSHVNPASERMDAILRDGEPKTEARDVRQIVAIGGDFWDCCPR